MEKKKFDFKQVKYKQIGTIYAKIKTFFDEVSNGLNEANLAFYEQQFTSIMNEAFNVMDADHFPAFKDSNTKRWQKIKQPFEGVKSPVQPTQTPQVYNYIPTEKTAENRAEMMPDDKDKEIARLKQIIENKDIIIQSLLKLNELQTN